MHGPHDAHDAHGAGDAFEDEDAPAAYDEACAEDEAYQAALSMVAHRMGLKPDDVVLDMMTGTGSFALAMAPHVAHVHARDPEPTWLAHAEAKAKAAGVQNVTFAPGTLAEPRIDEPVTVVLAAFMLHHVLDEEGPDGFDQAVRALTALKPRRLLLPDYYAKDARAADGTPLPHLEESLETAGYSLVGVEWFSDGVGIVVAEREQGS